tara:strand:- start:9974 stop:11182 length:1209 start_codon:yes stop_codon:yes gene_type:complete
MEDILNGNNKATYANVILFIMISLLAVNDMKEKPERENDPHRNKTKETIRMVLSILSAVLVFLYIVVSFTTGNVASWTKNYYISLLVIGISYGSLLLSEYSLFNTIMYGLLILIVIVGLAMFFSVFVNYLKSLRGIVGFIVQFIFYIPCMLLDLIDYLRKDASATPNKVLLLFFIELILITLYLYLPNLSVKLSIKDGISILEDYKYLHEENILPISEHVRLDTSNVKVADIGESTVRTNYAMSMWTYLNNYSISSSAYNKESLIFDYGNGKPKLTYFNDENEPTKMDTYRFYFSNNTTNSNTNSNTNYYELKMPSQKWNHIVFNYSSKHVDLYINGKLERTFYFKENVPTYNLGDVVTIGSENGLSGAISNIRYYPKTISSRNVVNIYNTLMNKNPPINNL